MDTGDKKYFDHSCCRWNINSQHTQYSGRDSASSTISSETKAKFMNIFSGNPYEWESQARHTLTVFGCRKSSSTQTLIYISPTEEGK